MKRTVALVYVGGLFVLGVLVGALAMHLFYAAGLAHHPPFPGPDRPHRPDFAKRLERELDLTPDQRRQIDGILDESRAEAEALHEEMLPRVREQMDRTRRRISEVLTPEQRDRFEELSRRHRGRLERLFLGHGHRDRREEQGPPPGPGHE